MTGFDIAVLILVGFAAIGGFFRGFVHEILSLVAWIAAIAAIRAFHAALTGFLMPWVSSTSGAAVLAFVLLLAVPYFAIRFVARWLGEKSRSSLLGPIDRVLGFGFGAVKGTIIVVMGFSVLVLGYDTVWGVSGRPDWITGARTYPFVNASSEELVKLIARHRRNMEADSAAKAAQ